MWTLFAIFAASLGLLAVRAFIAAPLRTFRTPPMEEPALAAGAEPGAPYTASVLVDWPHDEPAEPASIEPARTDVKDFTIELIPYSMNYKNARAVLTVDAWCLLRYLCLKSDGAQCSECGSTDKEDLECHEVWEYRSLVRQDRKNPVHTMKLTKMRMLCHLCHMGKHLGFARKNPDEYAKVRVHLLRVHGLSESALDERERAAFEQVEELDDCGVRELDLTYLNDDQFQFVRYRSGRKLFSTNEVMNCRAPAASEDLAS